jgi:hypothetical protein
MTRAKVAAVLGALLLGLGFYFGTGGTPPGHWTVTVGDESRTCGATFPSGWLNTGAPAQGPALRTAAERSVDAKFAKACAPLGTRARVWLWGSLGLGGLLLLSGWTVARELREREEHEQAPQPVLTAS